MKKQNKGITLIALIITIIVMLILVGVTINVALNGGLFTKAEQATKQMEASMVKEQFEIAKAVEIANNGGKKLEDYSIITIDKLDLDESTKNKYKNKVFMSAEGDVCYNADNVTEKEKEHFAAVGIEPGEKVKTGYSFTLNELGDCYVDSDSFICFDASNVWKVVGTDLSQNSEYIYPEMEWFPIDADSNKFQNIIRIATGEELSDTTEFVVGAYQEDGVFYFKVTDRTLSGEPLEETTAKPTEFLAEYGDVTFTFVKVSELGTPTE